MDLARAPETESASAPRKYDEETRARAVRMYFERIRDLGELKLTARGAVGAVLDINPAPLRNWVEREEIDTGVRPGVTSEASGELKALRREVVGPSEAGAASSPPRHGPRRSRAAVAERQRGLGVGVGAPRRAA